jgi:hypothetical protein
MGMNSADLYYATDLQGSTITYNRTKNKALISVVTQTDSTQFLCF